MDLIEDLDPEEARRIVDPALQLMMDAVHRYEGYVVQSTGDGIFAFFGAPIAHEDHPHRALYAGLRMQEESKRYAARLREENGVNLQIRVGVNTGEVVLRAVHKDDLRTDYTPIGHSTSLAARLESLATPGSVLVSENTYRLTDGYFEFKALGAAKVKGVTEPVRIYEVLSTGPLRTRLQVAARRGLARFVGRQSELEQIRKNWELSKAGRGQIVGVVGEPGVGKSRLFHEFKLAGQKGCLVLETFSVSHGKARKPRRGRCWPRSTTGSPRGSIRRICKTPKRCWKNGKGRICLLPSLFDARAYYCFEIKPVIIHAAPTIMTKTAIPIIKPK